MPPKQKTPLQSPAFQPDAAAAADDSLDAGGSPPPLTTQTSTMISCSRNYSTIPKLGKPSSSSQQQSHLLQPSNSAIFRRPAKRSRAFISATGKENIVFTSPFPSKMGIPLTEPSLSSSSFNSASPHHEVKAFTSNIPDDCGLDSISSTIDCGLDSIESTIDCGYRDSTAAEEIGFDLNRRGGNSSSNSLDSKLLTSTDNTDPYYPGSLDEDNKSEEVEHCTQLDVLLKLCSEVNEQDGNSNGSDFDHHQECRFGDSLIPIHCPLCGTDISDLTDELRQVHTNVCLDKEEETPRVVCPNDDVQPRCPGQVVDGSPIKSTRKIVDVSPVLEWLRNLGLAKYEQVFVREEIDWDTLQWLTEEDLVSIGVTALGPRKKIVHALGALRKESTKTVGIRMNDSIDGIGETSRLAVNKLITDYFPGPVGNRKKDQTCPSRQCEVEKCHSDVQHKPTVKRKIFLNKKLKDIPQWCCIPGTPFRVDAFKYLRRDCSHWFLTHFHVDHYQGLTRSFSHGKIYCSLVTAKLVNLKIGITWDKLQVLHLNQKVNVAGVDVTCFDANHCPGSIIILFEPPNGKAVLHTGDFRFCEEMTKIPALKMCSVQTLILDTTYCNPQYDFPKQETVFQFVIEAIQAEAFNPKTLFLIGSYTIGKERLFLEVARVLREKVYVTAAKLRLLECLGLPTEDMQWFTSNELESHIHVVPMWTLASFKRLKSVSNQYMHRFSLIVAFSPTGWTFGKGKKKSSRRRWQQGTIVRYEIPYSEHCSFTELKEFVKFVSPESIIPSVNNDGPESASAMISLLSS